MACRLASVPVLTVSELKRLQNSGNKPIGSSVISLNFLAGYHIYEKKLAIFIDNGYKISFFMKT
jgi:hypothetical protein